MEMNVQDVFLNRMRRSGESSIVRLIDGTEIRGVVIVFDAMSIIVNHNGFETLVYKQNVISVSPSSSSVRCFTENADRKLV